MALTARCSLSSQQDIFNVMNEEQYFGKDERPGQLNKGLLGPFRGNIKGKKTPYVFNSAMGTSG